MRRAPAFLYAQAETVLLGHSVRALSEKAGEYEHRLGQKRSAWSMLDGYYIPTRYPNGLPDGRRREGNQNAPELMPLTVTAEDVNPVYIT